MSEYITWYMCFKHNKEIEEEFIKYVKIHKEKDAPFLICRETATNGSHAMTDGQHYHFIMKITKKGAKNYMKHFIEKYKLRGQAKSGIGRQYGMQNVKDKQLMCTYICKEIAEDNPFVASNMSEEDIAEYTKNSYKKYTYEDYKYELFKELNYEEEKHMERYLKNPYEIGKYLIKLEIIKFHLDKMKKHKDLKPIRKNQVVSLEEEYQQRYKLAYVDPQKIYDSWFPYN